MSNVDLKANCSQFKKNAEQSKLPYLIDWCLMPLSAPHTQCYLTSIGLYLWNTTILVNSYCWAHLPCADQNFLVHLPITNSIITQFLNKLLSFVNRRLVLYQIKLAFAHAKHDQLKVIYIGVLTNFLNYKWQKLASKVIGLHTWDWLLHFFFCRFRLSTVQYMYSGFWLCTFQYIFSMLS